mmetsp:Transcript_60821/g.139050  ORF Transcript_60821/g.139050 Transcript_60821/m.139050 type:complete len:302 (+) Transcript_60821:647-1552(+)
MNFASSCKWLCAWCPHEYGGLFLSGCGISKNRSASRSWFGPDCISNSEFACVRPPAYIGRGTSPVGERPRGEVNASGDPSRHDWCPGSGDDIPVGVSGRRDRGVCGPDALSPTSPACARPLLPHSDSNRSTVPWYRFSLMVCAASFQGVCFAPREGEFGVDPTCGTRLLTNSSGTRPPPEPFEPLDPLDEGADGLSCALGVSGAMGASPPSSSESTLRLDRERSLSPVGLVPSIIAGGGSESRCSAEPPRRARTCETSTPSDVSYISEVLKSGGCAGVGAPPGRSVKTMLKWRNVAGASTR